MHLFSLGWQSWKYIGIDTHHTKHDNSDNKQLIFVWKDKPKTLQNKSDHQKQQQRKAASRENATASSILPAEVTHLICKKYKRLYCNHS